MKTSKELEFRILEFIDGLQRGAKTQIQLVHGDEGEEKQRQET